MKILYCSLLLFSVSVFFHSFVTWPEPSSKFSMFASNIPKLHGPVPFVVFHVSYTSSAACATPGAAEPESATISGRGAHQPPRGARGWTALIFAASKGHDGAVQLLLGAKADAANENGAGPWSMAVRPGRGRELKSPLRSRGQRMPKLE